MELSILIAAFGGGVVRGLVGFVKHQYSYKNVGFNLPYFLTMMFVSGVIGVLCVAVFNVNAPFAFIIGYAGGDFLENVYKIIVKKPSLYKLPTNEKE